MFCFPPYKKQHRGDSWQIEKIQMSPTNNNSSCSSSSSSAAATAAQAEIIDIRTTKHSNTTENLVRFIHDAVSTKNIPFNPATSIPKNKDNTSLKTTSSSYLATPPSEQLRLLRSIPTLVLYDNKGLDIFDKITYCEDYYLTNAEIDIFKRHAQEMVQNYMQDGSVIIELGVG